MIELNNQIALIELRAEQLLTHVQTLDGKSRAAAVARSELRALLEELVELKTRRDRREIEAGLVEAAA